jgi:hypothetical protein
MSTDLIISFKSSILIRSALSHAAQTSYKAGFISLLSYKKIYNQLSVFNPGIRTADVCLPYEMNSLILLIKTLLNLNNFWRNLILFRKSKINN